MIIKLMLQIIKLLSKNNLPETKKILVRRVALFHLFLPIPLTFAVRDDS